MTARAAKIARAVGAKLPVFTNQRAARSALTKKRDEALARLRDLARSAEIPLDRTPESLRPLEDWYLDLHRRRGGFPKIGTTRRDFEDAMSFYVGAVAVRTVPGAKWVVEGQGFVADRYEIGVEVGLSTSMIEGLCDDWHRRAGVRKGALLRNFRDWWPAPEPKRKAKGADTGYASTAGKPPPDEAAVRAAVLTQIGLKSYKPMGGGTLFVFVRHRLRDDRVPAKGFFALLKTMVDEGRVATTPSRDPKKGPKYLLAR
jgi:hypothetical protein